MIKLMLKNCAGFRLPILIIALAATGFLLINIYGLHTVVQGAGNNNHVSPYAQWEFGPSSDPNFFPIGVWLQNPSKASQYKAAGFNFYFGLWQGPTEFQLIALQSHGMRVICDQNEVGLSHRNDSLIMGWMHGDEPDNAQWNAATQSYDPFVPTQEIIDDYHDIVANDSKRPVFLNLGQGVANDEWKGRGSGASLDDYPEYVKGADVVSFDVYPVVGINKDNGEEYLWYQAKGVDRLREWTNYEKPIWNFIECTHISNPDKKATPQQVKAEVWMSLIHGSRGICYFVHQFEPTFIEAALLVDGEMLSAVTEINRQIHELAPVLNSPTIENGTTVVSSESTIPIDAMVKHYDGSTYLFAVPMRLGPATGSFEFTGYSGSASLEVLGEDRTINVVDGIFEDSFETYEVHLYKISDVLTGVKDEEERGVVISDYSLAQNYPNPFNLETVIRYTVPVRSFIELSIYNITGDHVTTLVSSPQSAGEYSINWDGKKSDGRIVSSGIYLYQIKADNFSETRKMLLLK